jgi:hypothetical protein
MALASCPVCGDPVETYSVTSAPGAGPTTYKLEPCGHDVPSDLWLPADVS